MEEEGKQVLFSGCSHKGILNIADWFRPDVLIGGFHFMKLDVAKDAELLAEAANRLLSYPTRYFTGHCTGLAQYEFLREKWATGFRICPREAAWKSEAAWPENYLLSGAAGDFGGAAGRVSAKKCAGDQKQRVVFVGKGQNRPGERGNPVEKKFSSRGNGRLKRIRKELSSKGTDIQHQEHKTRAVRSARSLCQILIYFPEKGFAPQKETGQTGDRSPRAARQPAAGVRGAGRKSRRCRWSASAVCIRQQQKGRKSERQGNAKKYAEPADFLRFVGGGGGRNRSAYLRLFQKFRPVW